MISENILTENSNKLITMISRIHTLTPRNSKNLEKFESSYNSLHSFYVTAGSMNNEGIKFYENFDTLLILKKDIFIVNAWEITVNDIEKIALLAFRIMVLNIIGSTNALHSLFISVSILIFFADAMLDSSCTVSETIP